MKLFIKVAEDFIEAILDWLFMGFQGTVYIETLKGHFIVFARAKFCRLVKYMKRCMAVK
jgi:hypothetical protein